MIKKADDCQSLNEVRFEIDRIDKEIINLFAERFEYVKAVVKFRDPQKPEVADLERFNKVIAERGKWAGELGLNAPEIEKVYRQLIEYYIKEQSALAKLIKENKQ